MTTEAETKEGLFHKSYIAGVKFRDGAKEHLETVEHGAELMLEADRENEYDPNAMKIVHDGVHVGFVPRDLSAEVRELFDAGRVLKVERRTGQAIRIYFKEA